jgi:NAD(P)-dependent dehydrogenase (short-subunit alcohol dehydrogenase family)
MKHCVVTGGTRGIGRAVALAAARRGWSVSLVGRRVDTPEVDALRVEISDLGVESMAVAADVSRDDDVRRAFDAAASCLGSPSALVNAAGVSYNARLESFEPAAIERLFQVNVFGTMWACREAVLRMSPKLGGSGGAIVNVSSMAATIGGRPGASAYAASKGAVDVFSTGLAKEVAREGIRVNVVRPGAIATDMTIGLQQDPASLAFVEASIPQGRLGRAEEVAAVVVWLLSEEASLVTGAHVDAGGGGFYVGAPNQLHRTEP